MTLEILEPGLSTTVQDRGRFGHYNVGIPQGGSMDQLSAEIVNALVGNSAEEAVLECTYLGPKFRTSAPAVIAVGGAPVEVKVNGATAPQWEAIELAAGDEVSFGFLQGGTRYYVAVRGGIDVPLVLGSRSTYALGALGGYQGRKLAAGDEVPVGDTASGEVLAGIAPELRPAFPGETEIRVLLGLYDHRLTESGLATLLDSTWTLTPVADRTGLRYSGPAVEWKAREQPFGAG
ncbi:MAG TPA: biotin-dependent carboxyltransferase family protein, partial [Gemmatimonadales bacterium]